MKNSEDDGRRVRESRSAPVAERLRDRPRSRTQRLTRKLRRVRALLYSAPIAMALVLAACGSSAKTSTTSAVNIGTTAKSGGLIIDINGPLSDPFFTAMKQGADVAARALGINYQYSAAANENNLAPDYSALIKDAIARHPAAIAIGDFIPATFDPLIKQATRAGIPVVVLNTGYSTWQSDGAIAYVGSTPQGQGLGDGHAALGVGVHHLLCVDNVPANPSIGQECQAAGGVMRAAGGTLDQLNLSPSQANDPAAQTEAIRGYVVSHPSIDGITDNNSATTQDVLSAVKSAGKSGKIKVGSTAVSTGALEDVQSGTMAWINDQQAYLQGFYSLVIAAQYVRYGVQPTAPVLTGGLIINKSNVAKALAVQQKYPGLRGAD